MRLTQRLLLGALVVVGFLAISIFFVVDRQLNRRLSEDATTFLAREAQLVGELWQRDTLFPDSLADRSGSALGRRVTLVRTDGVVIGDSEFDDERLRRLQNHAQRPEVAIALMGSTGTSRRPSPSTGDEEIYVAVPVSELGVARVSFPTASLDAVLASSRRDVGAAALIALLGALAIAFLFSRSVSRPVEELRDVAQALADGDLARRPTMRAPGEVGDLAVALRRLAEQLSARLRALEADETLLVQLTESLNEGVIAVDTAQQIVRINETARRLLGVQAPLPFPLELLPREVALRDALLSAFAGETTEGAEVVISGRTLNVTARPLHEGGAVLALFDLTRVRRLEAVRRDFVANVSHELRTPLTIVGGFAETLADADVSLEDRRQFADRILGNTRRMQRIVDDLLDLSRIESGGWVPNPTAVNITAMAHDVLSAARDAAATKGLSLTQEIDPSVATVQGDATALRQILGNLVDNAVRHTTSGVVTLFAQPHERGVALGVRDTGVGIAPEHLPRIFERFYRVDPGRSREQGGTGLGLAIVKHLVEAHGGRVRAESTVGQGTTITAIVPKAQS
ncbi:MAG: HAMP domain-containing protein [Gemmatimonadaceae bacterium]|nr:HAMP domain-containing protein [Gemmatimonadaceae bacterium]